MENPWKFIKLSDYESHMALGTVMQLQVLNRIMKKQLDTYPVQSAMVLGVAGGNGLEHLKIENYTKVYGIDINADYLQEVEKRYQNLFPVLECICLDVALEGAKLPTAELLIANLFIEYIGYACFQKTVTHIKPTYISCTIQMNADGTFVSDSPYLQVFDDLDSIHQTIETEVLIKSMQEIGYQQIALMEYVLPNGKKLVKVDFVNRFFIRSVEKTNT